MKLQLKYVLNNKFIYILQLINNNNKKNILNIFIFNFIYLHNY